MKKLTDYAAVAVAVLLILIAALVYLGPRMGYRADNVLSGSMEPVISRGTMIVAEKVEPDTLQTGDIITFKPVMVGETNICHRIIEVINAFPVAFRTQGDALPNPDPWQVPSANVLGRVTFHFPLLGYFIGFLKTRMGLLLGLVLPAVVIAVLVARGLWKELVRYIRSAPPKEG